MVNILMWCIKWPRLLFTLVSKVSNLHEQARKSLCSCPPGLSEPPSERWRMCRWHQRSEGPWVNPGLAPTRQTKQVVQWWRTAHTVLRERCEADGLGVKRHPHICRVHRSNPQLNGPDFRRECVKERQRGPEEAWAHRGALPSLQPATTIMHDRPEEINLLPFHQNTKVIHALRSTKVKLYPRGRTGDTGIDTHSMAPSGSTSPIITHGARQQRRKRLSKSREGESDDMRFEDFSEFEAALPIVDIFTFKLPYATSFKNQTSSVELIHFTLSALKPYTVGAGLIELQSPGEQQPVSSQPMRPDPESGWWGRFGLWWGCWKHWQTGPSSGHPNTQSWLCRHKAHTWLWQ